MTDTERHREAISLLDGCKCIIETWKPESPAQHHWKGTWLQNV